MLDTSYQWNRAALKSAFFVVLLGLLLAATDTAQAQTYNVLYNFCSQPKCADGNYATGALVQDKNGNLYGTTIVGGTGPACDGFFSGCGTVFELSSTGAYSVLHSFTGSPDGESPGGLVFDQSGNLFGPTGYGGSNGDGAIFELTASGTEKVIYSFSGGVDGNGGTDGAYPNGPLVLDATANLYGTTIAGGAYDCEESGCGTVFELTPAGVETQLHAFTGEADDGNPKGGLIRDAHGNLFGTTAAEEDLGPLPGSVFEITSEGDFATLYSFCGCKDGGSPYGNLVQDAKGDVYGTTYYGGKQSCYDDYQNGCGVVFKLTPHERETVRHKFGGKKDGVYPTTGLVADAQGNLYGTTPYGGDLSCTYGYIAGCGVVFEIPKKGKEIVLHAFTGGADGGVPQAALLIDAKGNLYGTTTIGGANSEGVIFKLTP
jgi:uncharacterized repeat protein (TIGR03803 family)